MRNLLQLLIFIPSICQAVVCGSTSPLAKSFMEQQSWIEESVEGHNGLQSLQGFVDKENNFHLSDASRDQKVSTNLVIDKNNDNYESFLKLCNKRLKRRKLISSYRKKAKNNSYKLSVRYLPEVTGYKNSPLRTLKKSSYELTINYKSDSIVENDRKSEDVKNDFYNKLMSQLEDNQNGEINLDLTNMDDLACDLMRGDAHVSVYYRLDGQDPIVKREVKIHEPTVMEFYTRLTNELKPGAPLKQRLFEAGVVFGTLKAENSNVMASMKTSYEVLNSMLDNKGTLKNLGLKQLKCVAANAQKYVVEPLTHFINVDVQMDNNQLNEELNNL